MKSRNLKKYLSHVLNQEETGVLIRGFDVVGDVAIIIIPDLLLDKELIIGEALLQSMPHVRVVARRDGYYSGEFRTVALKRIAGCGNFITQHNEFGVRLRLDPAKVYYSPRNGAERYRIAKQVVPGENVLVMFSGIAPLPLVIAKHGKASMITAIEKNPIACLYAEKSLHANKRIKNIRLIQGDVEDIVGTQQQTYDRIAMPLPASAERYLDLAFSALGENGWLHYYDFRHQGEFDRAVEKIEACGQKSGRKLSGITTHKCGHVSPGKYRICVDVRVQ